MVAEELLNEFADSMLRAAGMQDLAGDERRELVQELKLQLQASLFREVSTRLSADDLEHLKKMVEDKQPSGEVQTYLRNRIPDLAKLTTDTFQSFKAYYLGEK